MIEAAAGTRLVPKFAALACAGPSIRSEESSVCSLNLGLRSFRKPYRASRSQSFSWRRLSQNGYGKDSRKTHVTHGRLYMSLMPHKNLHRGKSFPVKDTKRKT